MCSKSLYDFITTSKLTARHRNRIRSNGWREKSRLNQVIWNQSREYTSKMIMELFQKYDLRVRFISHNPISHTVWQTNTNNKNQSSIQLYSVANVLRYHQSAGMHSAIDSYLIINRGFWADFYVLYGDVYERHGLQSKQKTIRCQNRMRMSKTARTYTYYWRTKSHNSITSYAEISPLFRFVFDNKTYMTNAANRYRAEIKTDNY